MSAFKPWATRTSLGRGSTGNVYKAGLAGPMTINGVSRKEGFAMAIKEIICGKHSAPMFRREAKLQMLFEGSPHVLKCFGYFETPSDYGGDTVAIYVVLEYAAG
eukprot:121499_1